MSEKLPAVSSGIVICHYLTSTVNEMEPAERHCTAYSARELISQLACRSLRRVMSLYKSAPCSHLRSLMSFLQGSGFGLSLDLLCDSV